MAQHDYDIANASGAAVRADLNAMADAMVSNNSGATEPTTKFSYMWWADTTTGLMKQRNGANNAWLTRGSLTSAVVPAFESTGIDDNATSNQLTITDSGIEVTGGVYLGGTGAANKLDDYEEGTWTPTSTGNVLNVGRASYTKVGRMVTLDFSFSFSGNASDTTVFKIENLPFASSGIGSESQGTVMLSYAAFGAGKSPSLYKYTGDNHINLYLTGHGVSWIQCLNNMISTSSAIIGQITYPID